MKQRKFGKNTILVLIFLSLAALFVFALVSGSFTTNNRVQAAAPGLSLNAPDSPDANFICTIAQIAVISADSPARIHVKCTTSPGSGIWYFAASGDSANAVATNRYLTLLNTAYALQKPVTISYFSSSGSNIPGCRVQDCRTITAMSIAP
jgi:hypothetical protein